MKKKENVIIIVVLVIMVLAIIGVSYAAFNYTKTGTKVNSITTGAITMTYSETDNTISLNGALPTTDATGKKRLTEGEYFDFTVSSNISGDININYEISAKDVTTSERKIDGSNIKLYLTRLTDDGKEEGINEGIEKGIKQGINKEKIEIAKKLLKKGTSIEEIIELTELTEEEIKNLK